MAITEQTRIALVNMYVPVEEKEKKLFRLRIAKKLAENSIHYDDIIAMGDMRSEDICRSYKINKERTPSKHITKFIVLKI